MEYVGSCRNAAVHDGRAAADANAASRCGEWVEPDFSVIKKEDIYYI